MKLETTLFDKPRNIRRVRYLLYVTLILLLAADHLIDKHGHFAWENAPYFHAVYGFVACVAVIFIAKVLRLFLGRRHTYYTEKQGASLNRRSDRT